jgi:hypothetical protein
LEQGCLRQHGSISPAGQSQSALWRVPRFARANRTRPTDA